MPPAQPGSRAQRRVARTKAAIEDAFVQLVLERGYERVAVENISDRADLARATFYAHYPNKEAVLLSVFNRLVEDLMERISYQDGPWNAVRRDAVQTAFRHAADQPDLYRACMSDARTRQAYLSILSRYAEQLASMALDLFIAGGAWANGLRLDDLGYSTPAENH